MSCFKLILPWCYLLLFVSVLNRLVFVAVQKHARGKHCWLGWSFLYYFLGFVFLFFLLPPQSQGAKACSHVLNRILQYFILKHHTGFNKVYCIVNITLHGSQSECFTALHLCISFMTTLYSNFCPVWEKLTRYFLSSLVAQTGNPYFCNVSWEFLCVSVVHPHPLPTVSF